MRAARNSTTAPLGIARASFHATIVLMPITRPAASASGPPELPRARRTPACTHFCEPSPGTPPTVWITPVVSAPTNPIGLPIAIANSPARNRDEFPIAAAGRFVARTRTDAISRTESDAITVASSSRESQSCTRNWRFCATCALVMMTPSLDQITPEPLPRPPAALISTVERRSDSAISPNPFTLALISLASMRAFGNRDFGFLQRPTRVEADGERFADCGAVQFGMNVFEAADVVAAERDDDVADHQAGFVGWAVGLDFQHDGGGALFAFECLAKRFGHAHGLEADAEISARDAAFFEQRVDDIVHGCCGSERRAEAAEARRDDAEDFSSGIDDDSADGGRLNRDVEANVGRQRNAGPRFALGCDETHGAECGDWSAGACAADGENQAAGLERGGIAGVRARDRVCCFGFGAFQDGEIGGRIAADQRCLHDAAVRERDANFFVAAQRVFGCDDYSGAPDDAAGRSARLGMHRDDVRCSLFRCGGKGV